MTEKSNTLLEVRGVKKRFGGNTVLDGINIRVDQGEIKSLIGPNGAGKTTLFNLISGIYRVDAGEILFEGKRIERLKQHSICRCGIARTFQNARPFKQMSLIENVVASRIFGSDRATDIASAQEQAREILDFVGLSGREHAVSDSLTIGDIRRLEIARAIASKPRLILFDEVLAGLTVDEIETALRFIRRLRDEKGITVLLVEHIMRVVMTISDHVCALHLGKIICDGRPEEVANDKRVIESYMGQQDA